MRNLYVRIKRSDKNEIGIEMRRGRIKKNNKTKKGYNVAEEKCLYKRNYNAYVLILFKNSIVRSSRESGLKNNFPIIKHGIYNAKRKFA